MSPQDAPHILDSPVWHSLTTHHAYFAIGDGLAKRYPADIAPFAAVVEPSAAAFHDLQHITAKDEGVALVGLERLPDLPDWSLHRSFSLIQMVSERPLTEVESAEAVVALGADDVPEMLELVKLTEPGPFSSRTVKMGHYIGIRKEGRLAAMAGERMYPSGYHEISAVCTHPDYQGKGLAQLLVTRLVAEN